MRILWPNFFNVKGSIHWIMFFFLNFSIWFKRDTFTICLKGFIHTLKLQVELKTIAITFHFLFKQCFKIKKKYKNFFWQRVLRCLLRNERKTINFYNKDSPAFDCLTLLCFIQFFIFIMETNNFTATSF